MTKKTAAAAFPPPAKIAPPRGQKKLDAALIARAAKLYEAAADWDSVRPHARQSEVVSADDKEYRAVVLRNGTRDVLAVYSVWTKSAKPKIQRVGRFSAYPAALRQELAEMTLWELDHLADTRRALGSAQRLPGRPPALKSAPAKARPSLRPPRTPADRRA